MRIQVQVVRFALLASAGLGMAGGCAFDASLREYLDAHFWLPFSKQAWSFERANVTRVTAPFAGMERADGSTPLARLRTEYQKLPHPEVGEPLQPFDARPVRAALSAALATAPSGRHEREELELLDAKIEMRIGEAGEPSDDSFEPATRKLQAFLKSARTPEFLSEARGWLAHIYYQTGNQTAAGKIYLDELNRNGSNLGRETLLNSLRMTYGYDGGHELIEHLDEYFDTAEHAAFAIQFVTNPHRDRQDDNLSGPASGQVYTRIRRLLEQHANLLNSNRGSNALAALGMRTALRMGDPPGALNIAAMVPGDAQIRTDPDFEWMVASAHFLSGDFAGAEAPLLELHRSPRATDSQRAAAAYGLCGVYRKTGNAVEQLRSALWLYNASHRPRNYWGEPGSIADQTIYWAPSGWDLNLLLETDASDAELQVFLERYPDMENSRLVRYSLAVRYARENRYEDAAQLYDSIHAWWRAPRMRQLSALYAQANRTDLATPQLQEAKYKFAEFLSANSTRVYFNDQLWGGLQRYALTAATDSRLTRDERHGQMARERQLQDDQEELWRAYLILRDLVRDSGKSVLGRKSAQLAIRCLRRINGERFGRQEELQAADNELSAWLSK